MSAWWIRVAVAASLWLWIPVARAQDTADVAPTTTATPIDVSEDAEPVTTSDITEALARYRHEPSIARVIDAAIAHQALRPQRIQELASTARLAGWLPTIRLSARRGQTIDLLAAQSTTTDRNSASSGDDLVLEAQLTFDLARVVWSNQELRVEREFRAEREARQALIADINRLYFERRRLQIERDLSDGSDVESALRIVEIEGILNALSGGVFERTPDRSQR